MCNEIKFCSFTKYAHFTGVTITIAEFVSAPLTHIIHQMETYLDIFIHFSMCELHKKISMTANFTCKRICIYR